MGVEIRFDWGGKREEKGDWRWAVVVEREDEEEEAEGCWAMGAEIALKEAPSGRCDQNTGFCLPLTKRSLIILSPFELASACCRKFEFGGG